MTVASSMGSAYTATTDNPSGDNDSKSTPNAYAHHSVQNCDLKFADTYKLLVLEDSDAWTARLTTEYKNAVDSYEGESMADYDTVNEVYTANTARKEQIALYLVNESCLPEALVEALLVFTDEVNYTISGDLTVDINNAALTAALEHIPSIPNVEDETDLSYIMTHFTEKMNTIRLCQQQNDREQQRMEFVRETSESNEAYHKDSFQEMTEINESEVRRQRDVGKQLSTSLDTLYKENCFTKQNMFKDITLNGAV